MTDAETAKKNLEAAKAEVLKTDKEIQTIKDSLKRVAISPGEPTESNSLKVVALKVTGLPEDAKPVIHLQLSSPVEELTLTKLHDPLHTDAEGSVAIFNGVETSMATLTLKLNDSEIHLGSSKSYDLAPYCKFDALVPKNQVSQLEVDVFPDDESGAGSIPEKKTEEAKEKEEVKEEAKEKEEVKEEAKEKEEVKEEAKEKEEEEEVVFGVKAETKDKQTNEGAETSESPNDVDESEKSKDDTTGVVTKEESNESAEQTTKEQTETEEEPVLVQKESTEEETTETKDDEATPKPSTTDTTSTSQTESKSSQMEETSPSSSETAKLPIGTIALRLEYNPSKTDQRDELCDLYNKASKRRAAAMENLRQSATAVGRTQLATTSSSSSSTAIESQPAVKAGFLNKPNKNDEAAAGGVVGILKSLYERTVGPKSLLRRVFPVAKNYCLFFGVVALMHFKGQELALPAAV